MIRFPKMERSLKWQPQEDKLSRIVLLEGLMEFHSIAHQYLAGKNKQLLEIAK